jgi:hypothetical protein
MSGKLLVAALSSIALGIATPALAQPGGGGGGGGGVGGGMGGGGGHGVGGGGAGGGMGGPGGGMGGGGGHGVGGGGSGGGMSSGGASRIGDMNRGAEQRARAATMREQARANSRGAEHASPTALERANANSVLSGTTVVAGPLTGVSVGAPVLSANGMPAGRVEQIVAGNDGTVRSLVLRAVNDQVFTLAPHDLSVASGVLTALTLRVTPADPRSGQ